LSDEIFRFLSDISLADLVARGQSERLDLGLPGFALATERRAA